PFLISASTSAVTVTLFVTLLVVPVVIDANGEPVDGTVFHVVEPVQLLVIVETSSVRLEPGALVIVRLSCALSAPAVEGRPQLDRSNRTRSQVRLFVFGPTLSVAAEPKLEVGLFSSTYVSVVALVPESVHVDFVSDCEPAQRWPEATESDAA